MKNALLQHLKNETYCRLAPSKVQGVGVFAIRNIPKNTNPFQYAQTRCKNYNIILLSQKEVNRLPKNIQKLVKDFLKPDEMGMYPVPENGFNDLDITFYMNFSKNPNIDIINDGCEFFSFITNRKIKKGEELFINYDFL